MSSTSDFVLPGPPKSSRTKSIKRFQNKPKNVNSKLQKNRSYLYILYQRLSELDVQNNQFLIQFKQFITENEYDTDSLAMDIDNDDVDDKEEKYNIKKYSNIYSKFSYHNNSSKYLSVIQSSIKSKIHEIYAKMRYVQYRQRIADFQERLGTLPLKSNNILDPKFNQSTVYKHMQNSYPLVHGSVLSLAYHFLLIKRKYGSNVEQKLYKTMTMIEFFDRLATKRCVVFYLSSDSYVLRSGYRSNSLWELIGTDDEENVAKFVTSKQPSQKPKLADYLSYDELIISALCGISSETFFINNGSRDNMGRLVKKTEKYPFEGVYIGLVGARFIEKPNYMENALMVIDTDQNNTDNGYGEYMTSTAKESSISTELSIIEELNDENILKRVAASETLKKPKEVFRAFERYYSRNYFPLYQEAKEEKDEIDEHNEECTKSPNLTKRSSTFLRSLSISDIDHDQFDLDRNELNEPILLSMKRASSLLVTSPSMDDYAVNHHRFANDPSSGSLLGSNTSVEVDDNKTNEHDDDDVAVHEHNHNHNHNKSASSSYVDLGSADGAKERFKFKKYYAAYLDTNMFSRRIRVSLELFLFDADRRAKERINTLNISNEKKKYGAYCHIVGLGTGVWAFSKEEQDRIAVKVTKSIIEETHLKYIDVIYFAWMDKGCKNTSEDDAHPNQPIFDRCDDLNHFIVQDKSKREIVVMFGERNPGEILTYPYNNCLSVSMYAWDSNAFPGNEYYLGELSASGDPAAAACSTISFVQNSEINKEYINGKNTAVYFYDEENSTYKFKKLKDIDFNDNKWLKESIKSIPYKRKQFIKTDNK